MLLHLVVNQTKARPMSILFFSVSLTASIYSFIQLRIECLLGSKHWAACWGFSSKKTNSQQPPAYGEGGDTRHPNQQNIVTEHCYILREIHKIIWWWVTRSRLQIWWKGRPYSRDAIWAEPFKSRDRKHMIDTYQTFALGTNESAYSASPNRTLCTAGDQYIVELHPDRLLSFSY